MRSIQSHGVQLLSAAILSVAASGVTAAPITYSFAGSLDFIAPDLTSVFSAGQAFSGTLVYEPTTPDTNTSPTQGGYDNAIIQLSVLLGANTYTSNFGPSVIAVSDLDVPDALIFIAFGTTGAAVGSATPNNLILQLLTHLDPTAVQGDDLPLSLPPLTTFTGRDFQLGFTGCQQAACAVGGSIDNLTLQALPEPSSLMLACAALVLAGAARRHRATRPAEEA